MGTSHSASARGRQATLAEPERHLVVVAYDIPSDRRRARIANTILGYGGRIQGSVYEVWVTDRQLESLWGSLCREVERGDLFRVYLLCGACVARTRSHGHDEPASPVALIL
jgi:CRISPR-associated protein Cas2